ncbi:MAG: selenide, water dikinase SelD [Acidimicrobiales bacterium]|nr:selenide, water dikinase SelD [Acidimicrobiales bacterium]
MSVRLTEYSHGAGCGCKLAPALLEGALSGFASSHPSLLVGSGSGDDAAVWEFGEYGLAFTTDFFTPIVDDARAWGRIAATNAVSDIYAMGGVPLMALNLVAWNSDDLGMDLLRDVLAGGRDVAESAGFVIAGGHTIEDREPKYGLAVLGSVDPARILTNEGFRAGDQLVLTKPIGVGAITTAVKRGLASSQQLEAATATMTMLNAEAALAALAAGATGATDVTGFGLVGHLANAMRASGVSADVEIDKIPTLDGVWELCDAGCSPGGTRRNLDWCGDSVKGGSELDRLVVADPQTSGGLLFGVEPSESTATIRRLKATGHDASVIGVVAQGAAEVRLH